MIRTTDAQHLAQPASASRGCDVLGHGKPWAAMGAVGVVMYAPMSNAAFPTTGICTLKRPTRHLGTQPT